MTHEAFVTRSLFLLWLGCAAAAHAQDATPESEALRARVEQIVEHPDATLYGVHVAARRALPRLYELRGFTPAWTSPGARADLLRAIRESAQDGLRPEDYLLTALESARAQAESKDAPLEARVDYDLLLTDGLARLLYHLVYGKVDPRDLLRTGTSSKLGDRSGGLPPEVIDSARVRAHRAEKPATTSSRSGGAVSRCASWREGGAPRSAGPRWRPARAASCWPAARAPR